LKIGWGQFQLLAFAPSVVLLHKLFPVDAIHVLLGKITKKNACTAKLLNAL
jgi:hypothetical protein